MEDQPIQYKVILVGDSSVGKTCIYSKYTKNQYPKVPEPTVGQEFKTKPVTMSDGKLVKANIWDTAGQERYRSMMASNYRKAVGALLVYDITQRPSFESLQKWVEDIKLQSEPGIIITLIGNKSDLESNRMVSKSEGEKFAKDNNFTFYETSAVNGTNLNEIFESLLNLIHNKKKEAPKGANTGATGTAAASSGQSGAQLNNQSSQRQQPREMGEGSSCKC